MLEREHRATNKPSRAGFTLIELLVVIAIISLLVSILLPSLRKAKELAKQAVCATNQHGLGLLFHLYATENDQWVPHFSYEQHGYPQQTHPAEWFLLYSPYISEKLLDPGSPAAYGPRDLYAIGKAMPVFDCPSTGSPSGFSGYHGPDGTGYDHLDKVYDYMLGYAFVTSGGVPHGLAGKRLFEMRDDYILLIDYNGEANWMAQLGTYEDK